MPKRGFDGMRPQLRLLFAIGISFLSADAYCQSSCRRTSRQLRRTSLIATSLSASSRGLVRVGLLPDTPEDGVPTGPSRCDASTYPNESWTSSNDSNGSNGTSSSNDESTDCTIEQDYLYLERFRRRKLDIQRGMTSQQWKQPPHPSLGPCEFVQSVLADLCARRDCRTLVRSSTDRWKTVLRRSIGMPAELADESMFAERLEAVMSRPNNQFGLLLGADPDRRQFRAVFPAEPLDYGDGTCWLECRLRDRSDDSLLVVMGWQLQKSSADGPWLADGIDWQDFRDAFRPGIGREEWERICG